jgi:hypothetical protein
MCSPTGAQKSALAEDQLLGTELRSAYGTDFGESQTLFNELHSNLDTIVSAGPNQTGMSPSEEAAQRSQAINSAAASAKNVSAAIGERDTMSNASPGIESGITSAVRAKALSDVENNLSNQQEKITEQNYAIGRSNFDTAVKSEEELPGKIIAPATDAAIPALKADEQTSGQANENAAASKSWMGLVGGLAGGAASALEGHFLPPKK